MTSGSEIGIVALRGELDITRRDELREAFALSDNHSSVLIDLSDVTYADSSILSELLRFRAEAEAKHVRIALLIVSRQLSRLFQYAGLAEAFAVFSDRGEALTHLTSEAP
jgi:anti-sigma B factor antagonist